MAVARASGCNAQSSHTSIEVTVVEAVPGSLLASSLTGIKTRPPGEQSVFTSTQRMVPRHVELLPLAASAGRSDHHYWQEEDASSSSSTMPSGVHDVLASLSSSSSTTAPPHTHAHTHAQHTLTHRTGFRMDTDGWVKEYEVCKDLTQEVVQLIQVRQRRAGFSLSLLLNTGCCYRGLDGGHTEDMQLSVQDSLRARGEERNGRERSARRTLRRRARCTLRCVAARCAARLLHTAAPTSTHIDATRAHNNPPLTPRTATSSTQMAAPRRRA